MKTKPYPKYKPSGVEWLGDVPEHWEIKRLKHLALLKSGEPITTEEIEETGDHPVYGGNGIRGYTDRFTHEGFFVLIGRQGALCGNINYANDKFWASEHAVVVRPSKPFVAIWMGELLRCMDLNQYSISAAQPGLSIDRIKDLHIPIPPLSEQQAIADFLDRETGRIDALIAKKERLLKLLAEQRAALISLAVTRGLDPSVKLKPSGVEWLGEVPEHWEEKKVKALLRALKGAIKTGPFGSQILSSEMEGEDIKVYNQKNVILKDFALGENYISLEKYKELMEFTVFSGDFLITTRGTIGRCAIVPRNAEAGILHPCLMRLQINKRQVFERFLEILIADSEIIFEQLKIKSNNTTIDAIYQETLKNVVVFLPPFSEQHAIADFLDRETAKIDALSGKVKEAIEKLREYRSALISAAVTGKIDVREAYEFV